MNTAEPDVDQRSRHIVVAAAWLPPGSERPAVEMMDRIIRIGGGGKAVLTISDVTDASGQVAPELLVLEIHNTETGLVARDATHDATDPDDWAIVDVHPVDAPHQSRQASPPPWWTMPQIGEAGLLAAVVAGLAFASVVLDGGVAKAVCIALVALLVGLIGGLVASAIGLSRDLKTNHADRSERPANEEHRS